MLRVALRAVVAFVVILIVGLAAAQTAPKPISKSGLVDALKIGGLTPQELVQFVRQRGVDFEVTPAVETELQTAGAKGELIEAVRASFRPAVAAPAATPSAAPSAAPPAAPVVAPAAAPLGKGEILTLLQVGTPSQRIEALIAQRGVSFTMNPDIAAELQAAGATPALLAALGAQGAAAPAPTGGLGALAGPGAVPAAAQGVPSGPSITSIKQMRRIYIEKMPNDLDQFLRAEIQKQLAGRLQVVLAPEDADAIMTGVGDNKTGTGAAITGRYLGLHDNATGAVTVVDRSGKLVLWSSEAGDRSLLFGAVKRGGPRKVADRLISNLKKTLKNGDQ